MPRFEKGNAKAIGRPPGSRNKTTLLLDELGAEGLDEVIKVVNQHARKGDMRAASLLLSRGWPHRRGRPVKIDLPPIENSAGLIQANAAVVAALSSGEITPDEAASIASVLETQRRAIETHDHERRIRELQEKREEMESPSYDQP